MENIVRGRVRIQKADVFVVKEHIYWVCHDKVQQVCSEMYVVTEEKSKSVKCQRCPLFFSATKLFCSQNANKTWSYYYCNCYATEQ